ncbi:MAG: helix-turn-helix domain-containing protein [Acidobacteriota bacterium]
MTESASRSTEIAAASPAPLGSQARAGRLLTVAEVAELLRINKSTVYRMAKQGRLPATRVGRQWRFRLSVLEGLLEPS